MRIKNNQCVLIKLFIHKIPVVTNGGGIFLNGKKIIITTIILNTARFKDADLKLFPIILKFIVHSHLKEIAIRKRG